MQDQYSFYLAWCTLQMASPFLAGLQVSDLQMFLPEG